MQDSTPKPAGKARPTLNRRLIPELKKNRKATPTIKITVKPINAVIVWLISGLINWHDRV